MTQTLENIISRWNTNEGRPYKDSLIDWESYGGDGVVPPDDLGCMCAQGQVLHLLGGWSPRQLFDAQQREADFATAELLNISVSHAVLLRIINDQADGAPASVLTDPEKILGDQAKTVLAFWHHLDRMTPEEWHGIRTAAKAVDMDTAIDAAKGSAWATAGAGAKAAWSAAWTTCIHRGTYTLAAAGATNEIQGATIMRKHDQPFFFLPLFGFNDPSDI